MSTQTHVSDTVYSGAEFPEVARRLFGNIKQRFFLNTRPTLQELSHTTLGSCSISKIVASPHGVFGRKVVYRSFDADSIKVLVQVSGKSEFKQGGGRIPLRPNAAIIYDPSNPYFLMNATNVEHLILQIPRHALDDRTLNRLSRPFYLPPQGDGQSSTFSAFVKTSAENATTLNDEMRADVGRSLSCFTRGLVCDSFQTEMLSTMDNASVLLLRERIKSFLQVNYGNPDLTIDGIGRRMGCSTRYLHRAFEAEGSTLQKYIWNIRLDKSRDQLIIAQNRNRSISEISLRCGFSSSSHFCRLFKQRFEMTPKELRQSVSLLLH